MHQHFIGVDGGGSSTRAVLVNGASGCVIRRSITNRASNPHVNGLEDAIAIIKQVIVDVLGDASSMDIGAVTVALSGVDDSMLIRAVEDGLRDSMPQSSTKLTIMHDVAAPAGLILNLLSLPSFVFPQNSGESFPNEPSYCAVLIAGTGSVAALYKFGDTDGCASALRQIRRVGGRGPRLGDEGSAYKIVIGAVSHALRVWDGVDEVETIESGRNDNVQEAVQLLQAAHAVMNNESRASDVIDENINALVAAMHDPGYSRDRIAALAKSVIAPLAANNNTIAIMAFENAARELAAMVKAVTNHESIRKSGVRNPIVHVIMAGGVIMEAWEIPAFRNHLNNICPAFRVVRQDAAAVGAARIGALTASPPTTIDKFAFDWKTIVSECIQLLS